MIRDLKVFDEHSDWTPRLLWPVGIYKLQFHQRDPGPDDGVAWIEEHADELEGLPYWLKQYTCHTGGWKREWPSAGVVYFLMQGEEVAYVGKAFGVSSRMNKHRKSGKEWDGLAILGGVPPSALKQVEQFYIAYFRPKYNQFLGEAPCEALQKILDKRWKCE